MNPSRRRLMTVLGLVAVSVFCVALVLLRYARSGSTDYTGLIWNLFLAWIPFVLAVAAYDRWRRHGRSRARRASSIGSAASRSRTSPATSATTRTTTT